MTTLTSFSVYVLSFSNLPQRYPSTGILVLLWTGHCFILPSLSRNGVMLVLRFVSNFLASLPLSVTNLLN